MRDNSFGRGVMGMRRSMSIDIFGERWHTEYARSCILEWSVDLDTILGYLSGNFALARALSVGAPEVKA